MTFIIPIVPGLINLTPRSLALGLVALVIALIVAKVVKEIAVRRLP